MTEPAGTSPPGAAFSVMAEEDYILIGIAIASLIGIAIASTLCLVVSFGLWAMSARHQRYA